MIFQLYDKQEVIGILLFTRLIFELINHVMVTK